MNTKFFFRAAVAFLIFLVCLCAFGADLVTSTEYRGQACPINSQPAAVNTLVEPEPEDTYKGVYKCRTTKEGTFCVRIAESTSDTSLLFLSAVTEAASRNVTPSAFAPSTDSCCHLIGKTPDGTIYFECR